MMCIWRVSVWRLSRTSGLSRHEPISPWSATGHHRKNSSGSPLLQQNTRSAAECLSFFAAQSSSVSELSESITNSRLFTCYNNVRIIFTRLTCVTNTASIISYIIHVTATIAVNATTTIMLLVSHFTSQLITKPLENQAGFPVRPSYRPSTEWKFVPLVWK